MVSTLDKIASQVRKIFGNVVFLAATTAINVFALLPFFLMHNLHAMEFWKCLAFFGVYLAGAAMFLGRRLEVDALKR